MTNAVLLASSVSRRAGGLFTSVRRFGQTLAEIPGLTVNVLSLRDEFTEADLPHWHPLDVQAFSICGPTQFGYSPQIKHTLLKIKPDIVHVHGIWMYPSVAALSWRRTARRLYIISPRGMLDPWAIQNSAWKKRVAGWLYENAHLRRAACLHALCRAEYEAIRAYGLTNPVAIIPNGVDVPELTNFVRNRPDEMRVEGAKTAPAVTLPLAGGRKGQGRRPMPETDTEKLADGSRLEPPSQPYPFEEEGVELGHRASAEPKWAADLANESRVLLYLGRIHPKKGLSCLLHAWARVCPESAAAPWHLVIAGWDQGGYETELRRLADSLGLGQSVRFIGPQFDEAKTASLARAAAFILPSFSEGLPMAVLEAWAHRLPVLMTPHCNLPEGFAAGAALDMAPEPESIAEALMNVFALPNAERQAIGERGRKLVDERFTWPKVAEQMTAVYAWVLGRGSRPDCVVTD